ncbi:MAG: NUDIX hydrolase [Burkholderiales bacterium PBB6]|nr:MAG: NUDIX hydrolase [Burkholderiales bacterium PBB6]
MIATQLGTHFFQVRAAAIFISQGAVLLHRLEGDTFWSLPGGRVEPGEDAATTVVREMREELGQNVVCGPLSYVVENFFTARGKPHHEIGFYFQASFLEDSPLLDPARTHAGVEGARALEFKWFPLDDSLANLDVRPSFLRTSLLQPLPHFRHVVQREG